LQNNLGGVAKERTSMSGNEIVSSKWSAWEPDIAETFFGCPILRPYLIGSAFGPEFIEQHRASRFFFEEIVSEHFLKRRAPKRALSVCSGFGLVELKFAELLPSLELVRGIDLAPGAVAVANQRAKELGLDGRVVFETADLNKYDWESETYDLVIANGALHHLSNLESVVSGIHKSLAHGGMLYANEHVGVNLQDYPDRQIELINAFAYLVPPRLRSRVPSRYRSKNFFRHMLNQAWKGTLELPQGDRRKSWSKNLQIGARIYDGWRSKRQNRKEEFHFGILHDSKKPLLQRTDPSEGVRAGDIIPLLKKSFGEVDVRTYGGGAIPYAIDKRFYREASMENSADVALVDALGRLERALLEIGELQPEYAILMCEKA